MFFHSNKLILGAVLSSVCLISAGSVEAGCHGRSGGHSHGSSYHRPAYSSSFHSHVVHTHPIYPQPVYPYPQYPQQVYAQSQPVTAPTQPLPSFGPGQAGTPFQQGFAAQQSLPAQQGFAAQQGFPSAGQTAGQTGTLATPPGRFANDPSASTPQAGVQSQIGLSGAATQSPSELAAGGVQSPAAGAPVNSPPVDAQQSALQALGGFAPPQETATAPEQVQQSAQALQPTFTGTWTANLENGARIQLALQADGNFSWTAVNKEGQSSNFQGTYAAEKGSLSLTRSNDRQQLSGTVTVTGTNTFSLRLSVAQSSSIDFVRS